LDTRQYEVEFQDGSIDTYTANVIAANLSAQVDPEGQRYALFKGIVDHRYVAHEREMDYTDKDGRYQPKTTTLGWELCVSWADDPSSWLPLALVKDLNPIEAAEYAVSRDLVSETAFKWWVRKILRKRDRRVCKVKTRCWKRTHKYGI
jgi:hypothetical protein